MKPRKTCIAKWLLPALSLVLSMFPSLVGAVTVCPSGCDFTSISAALDDPASAGQDVIVDPGTYTESDLTVVNRTLQSSTPTSPESTIIDGSGSNSAVISTAASATIRGLTITGGNQIGAPGGGIRVSGGLVVLQDMIIENNSSDLTGGGVGSDTGSSQLDMSNTVIRNNTAQRLGGGIFWGGSAPITIRNSEISNNTVLGGSLPVSAFGGGIYKGNFSTLVIENTSITGNSLVASQRNFGAGMYTSADSTRLTNVSISNNSAMAATTLSDGGGIYFVSSGRTLEITSGTINGNTAADDGGGLRCTTLNPGSLRLPSGSITGNSPDDIFGCSPPVAAVGDTPADFEQGGTDADPVSTFTGDLFNQFSADFNLGGPMPLLFSRYYSSALVNAGVGGPIGDNWRHFYEWTLTNIGNDIDIVNHHGRLIEFTNNGSTWDLAGKTDVAYQLAEGIGQFTLLDPRNGRQYSFSSSGLLISIEDGKGNVHSLSYDTANLLMEVSDGLGRTLSFTYEPNGKLATVSDGSRTITFSYTIDDLISVTGVSGSVTTFAYDSGALMTSTTEPEGNIPFSQTWNGGGQVATQSDAAGNTHSFTYAAPDTTLTDPLTQTRVHTHTATGELSARQDQTGLSFSMNSDASGRRSTIADRLGDVTTYDHHQPSGKLASITNADTTNTTYTYTARAVSGLTHYDLTGISHADGSSQIFVYDGNGNLEFHTDQVGNTLAATYNATGRVLTKTNVIGGITTHTYNADATRLTSTDPAGNTISFGYDTFRRLNLATFADANTVAFTFDDEDRLTSTTDENGNTVTSSYDANGNLATITDPLNNTVTLSYDGNNRLVSILNPLGGNVTTSYDELGQVASITDENNNTVTLGHNSLGELTDVISPLGDLRAFTYDAEGILASVVDPLGNVVTLSSDQMGRITRVNSPLGNPIDFSYDAMGWLATTSDSLGNVTTFSREARGLLSAVSIPEGISASYTRNALGQITTITDANGNDWPLAYDTQGRQISSSDPLANSSTIDYDNRNRPSQVSFPGVLGTLTLTHDAAGNRTREDYSDGTLLTYAYDGNNRLLGADGISRSYDLYSQLAQTNGISISRDAGGRISAMTLATGITVSYDYDANGNLSQVSDWTGAVTMFAYDVADRLISIVRPNGVNTSYTYDNDGRLTNVSEGTVSSIAMTRDARGQITVATRNVPQAPAISQTVTTSNSFDTASQTNAYTYDALGRLTSDGVRTYAWDLASRLTSYTQGGTTVSFSYDAFGRRLDRTDAGVTREFVWNDALRLPSVSIEQVGSVDIRYYIHSPDGGLLYSIAAVDDSRSDYHFDEMGNTTFLSDASGNVIASYAYSPYGELLASTDSSGNVFTWQGESGVMQEGDDLYYLRARYYNGADGRFISRDPIKLIGPKEANPYQYAAGNPLRFIDPRGTQAVPEEEFIAADLLPGNEPLRIDPVGWEPFFEPQQGGHTYNSLFDLTNSVIHSIYLTAEPMEDVTARLMVGNPGPYGNSNGHSSTVAHELLADQVLTTPIASSITPARENYDEIRKFVVLNHRMTFGDTIELLEPSKDLADILEPSFNELPLREKPAVRGNPPTTRDANDRHAVDEIEVPTLPPVEELRDLIRIYQEAERENSCIGEMKGVVIIC